MLVVVLVVLPSLAVAAIFFLPGLEDPGLITLSAPPAALSFAIAISQRTGLVTGLALAVGSAVTAMLFVFVVAIAAFFLDTCEGRLPCLSESSG